MANRRALSDEAVQELLNDVTLNIEGDVTVMGADEGLSPRDLLFHEVIDGDSPSPASPSSPKDDDVIIDVDTSTMDYTVTPQKPHVFEEYMSDVDLSPVAGPSTMPDPGPSQYAERHRSAKRKLLPRMSTPLPKKRAESTVSQPVLDAQNSDDTQDTNNTQAPSTNGNREPRTESSSQEAPASEKIFPVPANARRAPDKTYWSRVPLQTATPQMPPKVLSSLATPLARDASTPADFFYLFIDEDMIQEIVRCTNIMIGKLSPKYAKDSTVTCKTSVDELKALIGVLIQSGAKQDCHHTLEEMFSPQHGAPLYRATMSEKRFSFLLRCLRFDDTSDVREREQRKASDKFTLFRNIFEKFVGNCKKHYIPGQRMTIDEQLLGFRGNCPFRVYIPSKPNKYGIKIIMACDADTYYMCNAVPYLGRKHEGQRQTGTAKQVTMELMEPYLDAGRCLTVDNWFTSLPLLRELHERNTTLVGTMRRKPYVPLWMITKEKARPIKTSAFLFQKDAALVSYKPKSDKIVLLLSSHHNQPDVGENEKPEIINYYNKTKGGVDVLDSMCSRYSINRKTRRWPLCMFYGLLNIAVVNSFVLYKLSGKASGKLIRRMFMHQLATEMTMPWATKRLENPALSKSLMANIISCFDVQPPPLPTAPPAARKRCALCPWKTASKCKTQCEQCHINICPQHSKIFCSNCQ